MSAIHREINFRVIGLTLLPTYSALICWKLKKIAELKHIIIVISDPSDFYDIKIKTIPNIATKKHICYFK